MHATWNRFEPGWRQYVGLTGNHRTTPKAEREYAGWAAETTILRTARHLIFRIQMAAYLAQVFLLSGRAHPRPEVPSEPQTQPQHQAL